MRRISMRKNASHGNRGRTQMDVRVSCPTIGSLFFSLPSVYIHRHARETGVSSSMAKYGTARLRPLGSRPMKIQYQHQQDAAGHRETMAWFWCVNQSHRRKLRGRKERHYFLICLSSTLSKRGSHMRLQNRTGLNGLDILQILSTE